MSDSDAPRPRQAPNAARAYGRGMAEAGPYLVLGVQVAGGMAFFVLGGLFADRWLGTSPWLLLLGAALGGVAVFYTLLRMVREIEARERARKSRTSGSPPRRGPN